jgi:hypothetical protein
MANLALDKDDSKTLAGSVAAHLRSRGRPKHRLVRTIMRMGKSVMEWLACFASCEESQYGSLSCDLAEDYWTGRISNDAIIEILNSELVNARRAASWAVSDRGELTIASLELLRIAESETDLKVKGRAIIFAERCHNLETVDKLRFIKQFLSDNDVKIQELANAALTNLSVS